jgi:hypothetical protein
MSDFGWGLILGVVGGYVLSLITLVVIWSLCVVSRRADDADSRHLS